MQYWVGLAIVLGGITTCEAAIARPEIQGRLATRLTPAEIEREAQDELKYPHFMAWLKTLDIAPGVRRSDPRNGHLITTPVVFQPTQDMWNKFFLLAAQDHLTCLRAFGLISREIKKNGVVVFGPGAAFEKAVTDNHIDLGLALPATHIGTAIWSPDPRNTDPEFLLHLKVFYTEPYIHQFPDHILPANLKIGFGPEETYWMDSRAHTQKTVDTDIYYGPQHGVGFRNVRGIGGQKRGFLGFMQKVFFFLPDAVDSMTINEKNGTMVTEAMVNTVVRDFETNPLYAIKTVP